MDIPDLNAIYAPISLNHRCFLIWVSHYSITQSPPPGSKPQSPIIQEKKRKRKDRLVPRTIREGCPSTHNHARIALQLSLAVNLLGLGHLLSLLGQMTKLPLGESDTSLLIDGGHQGRKHLVDIAHGGGTALSTRSLSSAGLSTSVPDADLGLETADGFGVGLGKLNICALLDHHVLEQSSRAAERLAHLGIGLGHSQHTLSVLGLALETGLGLIDGGIAPRLGVLAGTISGSVGVNLDLVCASLGVLLLLLEVGLCLSLNLVCLSICRLLLRLALNLSPDDIGGTQTLHFCQGALGLHITLELFVPGLDAALRRDAGDLDVTVELGLLLVENGLGLGALDVALGLGYGSLGVNLGNLTLLLTLALGFTDVTAELGFCDIDSGREKTNRLAISQERRENWAKAYLAWLVAPSWALRLSDSK